MVQFAEDSDDTHVGDPTDLLALYSSLDRKSSHVTPRDPQKDAFAAMNARRGERDLVLKMSTGYGKTSVALVYLYSYMVESGRPCVYLCPTIQLVEQVLAEANKLGLAAKQYKGAHPDPECVAGRALIVCTYDKLFNARSTFERDDVDIVPEAIVLDDAHSGIQEVRDAFTIAVDSRAHRELFESIVKVLRGWIITT